jgi:hypothetical protein
MPQYFDYKAAKEQGYNDDQILAHLIKKRELAGEKFDLEKALSDGYTKPELIEHLSTFKVPEKISSDLPKWGQENPRAFQAFHTAKDIARPVTEGTGAAIGAAAGTPLGPLGMLAGGALGYAISKKTMDLVDRYLNKFEKNKLPPTNVKKEMLQSLQDIKSGSMYEMFGQSAGEALPIAIELLSAPFYRRMTPAAKYVLNEANAAGIKLTPAEVTGHKGIALAEALMEKVWGATDVIRDFRLNSQIGPLEQRLTTLLEDGASKDSIEATGQKIWDEVTDYLVTEKRLQGDLLNGVRTKILAKLGTNQSLYGLGLEGKELLKARAQIARDRKNELYAAVEKYLPKEGFTTPHLAKAAKEILKSHRGLPGLDKEVKAWLDWGSKEQSIPPSVMRKINGLPANVRTSILNDLGDEIKVKRTWSTLDQAAKDMESIMRKDDPFRYTGLKGQGTIKGWIAGRLKNAIRKDMEQIAKTNPEAQKALEVANAFYGDYARVYKSKLIKKLINTDAGKLIDVAFRPNAIEEIKLLKEAAGPNGFLKLREGFMRRLVGLDKNAVFDPVYFRRNIIKYGPETLQEVFGKSGMQELKKIAREGLDLTVHKPNRNFLKAVTETDPDFIVDKLIGAPESKLQSSILARNLKIIRGAVKPETFRDLGDKLAEKLIVRSQNTGLVRPQAFVKMVDKYNERVLKRFFPHDKVEQLKSLANIGRRLQKAEDIAGNPSGTGQTLIAWGIFRMLMTNPVTGAVLSFTPKQLAKIYLSKNGMRWLTEGFRLPAGSKKAAVYFSRLSSIIGGEQLQKNKRH